VNMEDRLLFLIGPPRSGSTLLARMLGAHPAVHAPPEPHLLTPLAHLGYYARVERAPYDPLISEGAIRELVRALPGGEADYLTALRAFTDALYAKLLEPSGRRLLLDKTPAYALVLDFAARLYPGARYVVLTRNPLAVWSSFVESFFDGDHAVAHAHNPLLERYVPAIARFLRERRVPLCSVRYEDLVQDPRAELTRICGFAGLDFDPCMVEYGSHPEGRGPVARGLGDPVRVDRESRPTPRFLSSWARELARDPAGVERARRILESLADEDLETWGFPRAELRAALDALPSGAPRRRRRPWDRHALERRALVLLRRNIHENAFGRLVRRVRFACDVLLR